MTILLDSSAHVLYLDLMSQNVLHAMPRQSQDGPGEARASHIAELRPRLAVSAASLDELATEIATVPGVRSLAQVLALGEIIHRGLRARGPLAGDRRASLRRLAAHPRVPFKVTTIWRAVSVYELSLRLPHLFQAPGLGVSHLRAVIGLDLADQEELLTAASREAWTKRKLEEAAAARRRLTSKRRGRRPLSPEFLLMREAERFIERADALLGADASAVRSAELRSLMSRVQDRATALAAS